MRNLRRAEGIRQKNYESRKAHRRFFSDPYRYGKALLDPQESLKWIGATGGSGGTTGGTPHKYSDDLRHIPLQVKRDIPAVPLPTSIFSIPVA